MKRTTTIRFCGTCPQCGFKREPKMDPATIEFGKTVIRTVSEMSGIKQSAILGKYGTEEERHARYAVGRYLRLRGWSWTKLAKLLKRTQAAGVYSMQNGWYADKATAYYRELIAAFGDGLPSEEAS